MAHAGVAVVPFTRLARNVRRRHVSATTSSGSAAVMVVGRVRLLGTWLKTAELIPVMVQHACRVVHLTLHAQTGSAVQQVMAFVRTSRS